MESSVSVKYIPLPRLRTVTVVNKPRDQWTGKFLAGSVVLHQLSHKELPTYVRLIGIDDLYLSWFFAQSIDNRNCKTDFSGTPSQTFQFMKVKQIIQNAFV